MLPDLSLTFTFCVVCVSRWSPHIDLRPHAAQHGPARTCEFLEVFIFPCLPRVWSRLQSPPCSSISLLKLWQVSGCFHTRRMYYMRRCLGFSSAFTHKHVCFNPSQSVAPLAELLVSLTTDQKRPGASCLNNSFIAKKLNETVM